MNILVVYAHHEPSSLVSAMKNTIAETMIRAGHTVVVSDLYAQGFNPTAQKWDFVTTSGEHFNYMFEQRHAARLNMSFSPDIMGEIQKIQAADFIIFVAPMWWMSVPAMLKGWFDRVLAMGFAWDGNQFYENGLLRGKQAMLVISAGQPREYYQQNGANRASVAQILHPINYGTLGFCGLNVHEPFVALDVLAADQAGREKILKDLSYRVEHFVDSPEWLIYYR